MSQTTTDQLREILRIYLGGVTASNTVAESLSNEEDTLHRLTAILAAERYDELRLFDNFDDETNCFNDDALHYISRRIEQLKKQAEA